MTERVTIEQNGERFTVDVPDGTSDADIQTFISNQQASPKVGGELTQSEPSMMGNAQVAGAQTLARPVAGGAGAAAADIANVGKILYNTVTPNTVGEVLSRPLHYAGEGVKAFFGGLPGANMTMKQAVPALGKGLVSAAVAPESLFTLPYNMAAYEQEKIRANPNAPGLQYNPYAQTVRGEATTQGQAGSANQMRTVANMPYGNVNPQERAILEQDRMMRENIRKKAYQRVMGPIAPQ